MAASIHTTKYQKLPLEQNQQDPTKFYYHFLYKALLVLIFFIILPLFPSQAPEFINQSLVTRNWELLHILFVGIAISYGLFSRRNNETEKDIHNTKFDNAQSLVSKFLQVSSFFEDESDTPSDSDETKIQTWSNQHYRNEPMLVVAPKVHNHTHDSVFEEQSPRKPLLLPVRSLKSRLSDEVQLSGDESEKFKRSLSFNNSLSNTKSKRSSISGNSNRGAKTEHKGGKTEHEGDDGKKMEENIVLPSPIPWRSRSGKMESKIEVETPKVSSMKESEIITTKVESPTIKSQTIRSSSRASSLSPSNSFSSESFAKNTEDLIKKRGFYKSCPPPPPPPPPMMFHKSISMKTPTRYGSSFDNKELKRTFTSEKIGNGEKKSSFRSDKFMHAPMNSEQASMVVESDDEETETDDECVFGEVKKESEASLSVEESRKKDETCLNNNVGDEGPDVDKKADEFIAKFREQIRLQRIESIKRSTRNSTRNNSSSR